MTSWRGALVGAGRKNKGVTRSTRQFVGSLAIANEWVHKPPPSVQRELLISDELRAATTHEVEREPARARSGHQHTHMQRVRALLLLLSCTWGSGYRLPSPKLARRAALQHAAQSCCAVAAAAVLMPTAAVADLADLDSFEAAPVPMKTQTIEPVGEAIAITMTDAGAPKKMNKDSPGYRIKELEAKRDKTEKEKKELRRLKADEMCEMLGRGC